MRRENTPSKPARTSRTPWWRRPWTQGESGCSRRAAAQHCAAAAAFRRREHAGVHPRGGVPGRRGGETRRQRGAAGEGHQHSLSGASHATRPGGLRAGQRGARPRRLQENHRARLSSQRARQYHSHPEKPGRHLRRQSHRRLAHERIPDTIKAPRIPRGCLSTFDTPSGSSSGHRASRAGPRSGCIPGFPSRRHQWRNRETCPSRAQ